MNQEILMFTFSKEWRVESWWEVIADLPGEYHTIDFFSDRGMAASFMHERENEGAECSLTSTPILTKDGMEGWRVNLEDGVRVYSEERVPLPPPDIAVAIRSI